MEDAIDFDSGRDPQLRITTMGCVLVILSWTAVLCLAAVCWKIVAVVWAWAVS